MKSTQIYTVLIFVLMSSVGLYAQQKPVYEKDGDHLRVTHYHANGEIKETGTYYKKALNGKWMQYDEDGNIIFEAFYDNGDKEGKWLKWDLQAAILYEMSYEDNTLLSVDEWKLEKRNLLAER